jgi:FixJ family two-component response regulator
LEICGFEVQTFATARQYLEYAKTEAPCCLIVDLHLPEIDGLDLHNRLAQNPPPPVIFLSHLADIPSAVRAMKAGAIEFLLKPVDPDALRDSVRRALDRDKKLKAKRAELAALRRLLGTLTPREREVFPLVARGLLNKQAASLLGISEITLQIHRSQVMKKMGAQSLPDLVRMAVKLGVCR